MSAEAARVRFELRAFLGCEEWEPCALSCPGMFRDAERGRWVRCDDCATVSTRDARGFVETRHLFFDEDVRRFVRLLSRETFRRFEPLRLRPPRMRRLRLVRVELQRLNGWTYLPDPEARL